MGLIFILPFFKKKDKKNICLNKIFKKTTIKNSVELYK